MALGVLGEGSFFGEISTLSGRPRSATITAAAACELLELDRVALDAISASSPARALGPGSLLRRPLRGPGGGAARGERVSD